MQIGNLIEVILYVEDMARAVAFYRDRLGLPVVYPTVPDYAGEMWVVLSTGSCKLCLHGGAEGKRGTDAPKIVFGVADIHNARATLTDRGVALSEVRNPAPGVLVCDGSDPDGNPFSIESAASA
jgi:catechol 2,3-dioxygenase-like lactoylglutathione lyase family enzyme